MSPEFYRCVDDATVEMLERTSWRGPRDYLRDCAGCGMPFWVTVHSRTNREQLSCSEGCKARAYYRTHPAYRARVSARLRARYQAAKQAAERGSA